MNVQFLRKKIGISAASLACVFVAGCTQQGDVVEVKETEAVASVTESAVEKNIKTVEAVLQQELNGPDEEYVRLMEAAMGGIDNQESVEFKEDEMKLNGYIKEKYLPYFTEGGFDRVRTMGFLYQYHFLSDSDEAYEFKLIDSEVEQSKIDTADNQYHFKATVELTSPGTEPSTHELEGLAIFSKKEGKIGDFQFGQKDPTLLNKIYEITGDY